MRDRERALQLVERIYSAVIEPDEWNLFLEQLSELLGGAAIQLSLRLPTEMPTPDNSYRVGLKDQYHPIFVKHVVEGLPWGSFDHEVFRGRFGLASELISDDAVEETSLYREYMQPQDLAPEWPIVHLIAADHGRPVAGMAIYRRNGCRALDADDLATLDSLVPHLARAYAIHCQLRDVRLQRSALTEVIDRLPTGMILVDAEGRVVLTNLSADKILDLDDGLRVDRDRVRVADPREDRALQTLIQSAVRETVQHGTTTGEVMAVPRPSGRRPFALMVGPLLAASPDNPANEARAIVFVADPEGGQIGTSTVLETLYHLTHAEAELVRLVAGGRSLEEVATARGVTMNTVRSQLKQVFSKTDTKRQGELVHLVLSGVASIRNRANDVVD